MNKPKNSSRPKQDSRGHVRSKSKKNRPHNPQEAVEKLDNTRSNNPSWYYFDERIADQVSQLSFQNLAGYPIEYDSAQFDVPNIVCVQVNPCPGVQTSNMYNTALSQHSAINMSGFRLYSKLSAFTGRTQNYAPQDVSTMLLAMGEIISISEWIRRAFGIAYTTNMRNRDYPRQILRFGMKIDADDMFTNLSDYRTKFNTLMTLINQLPIPKNIAYFDKCASLYQKVFLDAPSSMAQTIVVVPFTTWTLDEQSYAGGSVLKTTAFISNADLTHPLYTPQKLSVYLTTLENMIDALLNSTSLQVVYTDIINLASKINVEFWRMDMLYEDYQVIPEYDMNFMLQMHNATITDCPVASQLSLTPGANVTPYNDVYPDVNKNSVFYNPLFIYATSAKHPRTGKDVIIDMLTDVPNLTDRVECTRYAAISNGTEATVDGISGYIDTTLPDHYIVGAEFEVQTNNLQTTYLNGTIIEETYYGDVASLINNIDWAPRIYEVKAGGAFTGRYTSDINFYTVVNERYLRKLHDFCGLALYDFRA